ncbi:MAG: hypothetical protein ABL901_00715 [Hyphomicrobiaceae bacterium]
MTIKINCRGTARIKDKITGEIFEIASDELDWHSISANERQMGAEVCYGAEVEHDNLGTLSWFVWEYPAGVTNLCSYELGGHELIENFDCGVADEPDVEGFED